MLVWGEADSSAALESALRRPPNSPIIDESILRSRKIRLPKQMSTYILYFISCTHVALFVYISHRRCELFVHQVLYRLPDPATEARIIDIVSTVCASVLQV